jgi:hypothetical protein
LIADLLLPVLPLRFNSVSWLLELNALTEKRETRPECSFQIKNLSFHTPHDKERRQMMTNREIDSNITRQLGEDSAGKYRYDACEKAL